MDQLRAQNGSAPLALGATEVERAIKSIPGLEEAGMRLSLAVHDAVLKGGEPTRALADFLHGVWLGHSLHAALVTVPIGAWVTSVGFDAYAGLSGSREADWAADRLLAIGIAAAVPTAMAGMADYSGIKEDSVAIGMAHALLNTAGLGLFLGSLWARSSGNRALGRLLSIGGITVAGASASLGGDMAYRRRVGVNHAPPVSGPVQWTRVLTAEELGDRMARRVEVDNAPVLLYRDGDTISAIGAVCSHAGGPLEEGTFADGCVECPWHQSVFNLRTGKVVHGPATHAQPAYEARVRQGQVEVRLVRSEELDSVADSERSTAPDRATEGAMGRAGA